MTGYVKKYTEKKKRKKKGWGVEGVLN